VRTKLMYTLKSNFMQINMTTNAILLSIVEPPWWNEVEMYVERESSVGYIRNC